MRHRLAAGGKPAAWPSLVGWDELSEEFRESSRSHARELRQLLARAGYRLVPAQDRGAGARLSESEVERLAEEVHQRWVAERTGRGWRFGRRRNDERKLHPDLVPWSELGEDRREIDRDQLRELPTVLKAAGLKLATS